MERTRAVKSYILASMLKAAQECATEHEQPLEPQDLHVLEQVIGSAITFIGNDASHLERADFLRTPCVGGVQ